MKEIITKNAEETRKLGRKIGKLLREKDILAFSGELGSGKTTLIQAIAEGIGVSDFIPSPTFILINEYKGKIPFIHIDLYRLKDMAEIEDLGISEYFEKNAIIAIEWAEKMEGLLPKDHIKIEIEPISENERKILILGKDIKRLEKL